MSEYTKMVEQDGDFDGEVLESPVPVLAHFNTTSCGPGVALRPILEQIGQDFQGKLKIVEINVDECTMTAQKYGIENVPAVLAFQGGQQTGSSGGLTTRENLLALVNL